MSEARNRFQSAVDTVASASKTVKMIDTQRIKNKGSVQVSKAVTVTLLTMLCAITLSGTDVV